TGAGNRERNPGEARGKEIDDGKAVERARLATLGRVVPRHRVRLRHVQIAHGVRVAGGSPQTDDVPDVLHPRAARRKQHRPRLVTAVRAPTRRPVGLVDRAVAAEPRGMATTAGKAPRPGHAITAVGDDGPRAGSGTPR